MITGKLMFDVEIVVANETELASLSKQIEQSVSSIDKQKILSCEEVDSDVEEQEIEEESQED